MTDERLLQLKQACAAWHDLGHHKGIGSMPGPGELLGEALDEIDRLHAERKLMQRKLMGATLTINAAVTDAQSARKQILTLIDGTPEQVELAEIRAERRARRGT